MKTAPEIRNDSKPRTGIVVLVRYLETDNLLVLKIGQPSERARFFAIEKGVRSEILGHTTSAESEDDAKMKWRGSVTLPEGLQVSVSGLKGDEDVAISLAVLAYLTEKDFKYLVSNLSRYAFLPDWCTDEDHYLHRIIVDIEDTIV